MTRRTSSDAIVGALMLVVAAGYYLLAAALPESMLADAVGPQGLPKAYAVILAALSMVVMLRGLRSLRDPRPEIGERPQSGDRGPTSASRVIGMLLIGVLYIAAVPWLGYLVSMAALILATTYYQGGVMNRRVVLTAASGALFLWLLFVAFLGIPQPAGVWTSLF
jgi:putative tricarboxylic transport membrane protein